jgi:hypothetical protein
MLDSEAARLQEAKDQHLIRILGLAFYASTPSLEQEWHGI